MEKPTKPTIRTIDGKEHEMIDLTGRAYRLASEFDNNQPQITDADFIERHAAITAEFFSGVTKDDILDMPLEEILPASIAARRAVYSFTWLKTQEVSKNSDADKEKEQ